MQPYYERDGIVLYLGDCRDVLPTLEKGSADLLVTDPPYGVGFQSNFGKNFEKIIGDDGSLDVPAALDTALNVLRHFRHTYVFGSEALLPTRIAGRTELIWDKGILGPGNLALPWGPAHESIWFGSFIPSPANRKRGDGNGTARLRAGSILKYQRPNATGVKRHPTEKPVPLLRRLIESSSLPGETVLDPFVGCGSTLVAAVAEGRKAVGIELDEGYTETAAKRADAALDAMLASAGALA